MSNQWKSIVLVNGLPIEQLSNEELEKFKLNMMEKFKNVFGLQVTKSNNVKEV